MAGFIRRFGFFPGLETITQIEGVVIIDLPPPGGIQGSGVGVAGLVGEFADCSLATEVDASGTVSTKVIPTDVFGTTDLIQKTGGFDETIGEFGVSQGNGFEALRSKRFSRLVVAPINLASAKGVRYFRQLPLSTSTTNTTPVVPLIGGTVAAGREFRGGTGAAGRIRIAKRLQFTANAPIATGVGGTTTNAGAPAATQNFTAAALFDWTAIVRPDGSLGARKGDVLVIGNNNAGALQPLPVGADLGAGTYRVAADPVPGNVISLERLDGQLFDFVTAATIPWRLHFGSDADSAPNRIPGATTPGGYGADDVGGYTIPTRPITSPTGTQADGTYPAGDVLSPAVAPPALTGGAWDTLSGLGGRVMPTGAGGLAFTVALQGINAPASATLDAAYQTAIDAFLNDDTAARAVNILWSARKSLNIRSALKQHVLVASGVGVGRIAVISPALSLQSVLNAIAPTDPGVGGNRDERVIYTWPGCQTFIQEAVGFQLKTAIAQITTDGVLDQSFDGFYSSLLSNLPPERNPGQAAAPVPQIFAPVLAVQRGVTGLGVGEYTQMRANGVSALRIDRTVGPIIQSGITSSLISGQKNVNRRRMADFIQDSMAQRLVQFTKLPITQQLKDAAVGEIDAFLNSLLSPNNPTAQRIAAYQIDDRSGNTPELEAQGIFVIIVRVRTLATADFIVLQTEIGEAVQILPLVA